MKKHHTCIYCYYICIYINHGPTIYISNEIDKFLIMILETISSNIEYNQNILDIIKKKKKTWKMGYKKMQSVDMET